jgi:hypothetical protein
VKLERELLGRAFLFAVAAGVGCVVVAAVVADGRTAGSAVVGTGLVVGFLALGQVPVAAAARWHRSIGAMLLLLGYVSRVMVLLLALLLLRGSDGLDRASLGLTVLVTALAWTVGTVWSMVRWKPMLIDPEALAQSGSSPAERSADRPPPRR